MKKRLSILLLCLLLVAACGMVPAGAEDASADLPQAHYGDYLTINNVYDMGGCYSMQGVAVDANNYSYCVKINGSDNNAFVTRLDNSTGARTYLTNAATGTYYFTNLGHANALDMVSVNGKQNLFVTGGSTLVRLTLSGTTLTTAGTYTATLNGQSASMTAVQIMAASNTQVKVMVKSGRTLYTGTLDPRASSGVIELTKLCTLNVSEIRLKGSVIDFSKFTQQGFDYHDGKVFLPLTGNAYAETINYSIVAVYDLEGASGEVKNDPSLSFRVVSGTYPGLFEIEDVEVCPKTGRLYFSVQRRKSASETDYDAVCHFYGYQYNPAMSTIGAADYRWETVDNELISVTDGGNVFNTPERFHGDINNNVMSQSIFSLRRSVVLNHDAPWVVEWKSSGNFSGGSMMLATARSWGVTDAAYLFRHENSNFIAFGAWNGSQHNNYGLTLSDHGIDGTAEHTYRLTNKIASDGSNMIYLSVDGVELGAMNNYYINATAQKTTSNWVSGKDFTFSYIGSYGHPMNNAELSYLQIWANGTPDTPDQYRWETTGDKLTSVGGYTENKPNMYKGTLTDGVYSGAAYRMDKAIVLMHDRPWSVEWQSDGGLTGGTFLLASSNGGNTRNAPFLFRYTDSGLLALGYRSAEGHQNFGVQLSDYSINGSEPHTYRLSNRVFSDGSNMVYLYVDDVEISAMNNYYVGINSQGTTSDWLNGKDLVFDYVGNSNYPLNGTMSYLQVNEQKQTHTVTFVDHNGVVLSTGEYREGQMPGLPADPVREESDTHRYTFSGWSPEVKAVTGDAVYMATYTAEPKKFTVTFVDENGTMISVAGVAYGTYPTAPEAPQKAGDAQYTYTFAGWSPALGPVEGPTTYTATYTATVNTYTVIFKDGDDNIICTQQVPYGSVATMPEDPVKAPTAQYTYTFAGWNRNFTPITENTTYIATFTGRVNQYTITFVNADGTVVSSQQVKYGEMPTLPADPTKAPTAEYTYTFAGWSPTVVSVTGAATYTATYTAALVNPPKIIPTYPTLAFEDEILYNVYFTVENLSNVPLKDMGLAIFKTRDANGTVDNALEVIPGAVSSNGQYVVHTNGIPAKNLGDAVYFRVYAKRSDGIYVYSDVLGYNAVAYAKTVLNQSGFSAKDKALVVAMLNYGAAAQSYFGYRTDSLMNSFLTAEQQALISGYNSSMVSPVVTVSNSKIGGFVRTGGFSDMHPAVAFEGAFAINYYFTPSMATDSGMTLYYWDLETYSNVGVLTTQNATGSVKMDVDADGVYTAAVTGISAKQIDQTIFVAGVYQSGGKVYCTGVIAYSLGRYCLNFTSNGSAMQPFAQATVIYGYYAKAYFAS